MRVERRLRVLLTSFAAALLGLAQTHADPPNGTTTLPDPASIVVPDVDAAPGARDAEDYWEYYYFHKPGVTFEKAVADFRECFLYSSALEAAPPDPVFVPLGMPGSVAKNYTVNLMPLSYGIAGLVAVTVLQVIVEDSVNHDVERANTRRCMGYKGYHRYGTSRMIWRQLGKGNDDEIVFRFAKIASGPQPKSAEIEP